MITVPSVEPPVEIDLGLEVDGAYEKAAHVVELAAAVRVLRATEVEEEGEDNGPTTPPTTADSSPVLGMLTVEARQAGRLWGPVVLGWIYVLALGGDVGLWDWWDRVRYDGMVGLVWREVW